MKIENLLEKRMLPSVQQVCRHTCQKDASFLSTRMPAYFQSVYRHTDCQYFGYTDSPYVDILTTGRQKTERWRLLKTGKTCEAIRAGKQ